MPYVDKMKRALITGSSRGIGLAVVEKLIQTESFEVIGTSTSGKHSIKKATFTCYKLDLGSQNSIDNLAVSLEDKPIDYLINNAAILLKNRNAPNVSLQQLRQTFEVNFFGTIHLTEKLISQINPNGHIINISSDWGAFSGVNFDAHQPHYKMSKAALNMYTKLLSRRLESRKITVSSLDPGWVKTDMGGADAHRDPGEVAMEIISLLQHAVPTGKFWHKGEIRDW